MKKTILFMSLVMLYSISKGQYDFSFNAKIPFDPQVKKGKLENGLTYYILKNSVPAKRAELRLVVNVGSSMENDDQQGLAHFTEHMCFNGTIHFPGNQLITYFESKGIRFGRDLNAYTSFEETVYRITVPTDSQDIFENAFLALEDWASNVMEAEEEVTKERGVIIEEWRLGQGAEERMRNKYWPVLFKDSRFADRLPIGKKEIVENCSSETLKSFYRDWYRPDLMAVIVVGDIDTGKVIKLINQHFGNIIDIKPHRDIIMYPVPDQSGQHILTITDKEATKTTISIYYKKPPDPEFIVLDMKQKLIFQLCSYMLNNRYNELLHQADPPFLHANAYYQELVRTKNSFTCNIVVKEDGINKGLEALVTENERIKRFGFTAPELERAKKVIMRNMESAFADRDKTESSSYTRELIDNYLENKPVPGITYTMEFYRKFLSEIKLEEINMATQMLVTDGRDMVIVVTGPESAKIPSDTAIDNLFISVRKKAIEPYKDKTPDKPLITEKLGTSPVEKDNYIKDFDITDWTLANGIHIVLKPTDFKNDQVLFSAFAKGGTSLCSDKDYIAASLAPSIIGRSGLGSYDFNQLQNYLKGRIANVNPSITELTEEFRGNASPDDIETLLQMIYMYFTNPREDSSAFRTSIEQTASMLKNSSSNPQSVFNDTVSAVMAQHNIRRLPLNAEKLKLVTMNNTYDIYKERFSNAANFTFCFVGNFKKETLKPLIEKYLGSLPVSTKTETFKDLGIRPPKGIINVTVKKGIEQKSTVKIMFTGPAVWNYKNKVELNALMMLAGIRLRESIREEKGGTYGIRAQGNIEHLPAQFYTVDIEFGCDPKRVEELTKAVFDELNKFINENVSDDELTTIKQQLLREREISLKENNFWLSLITSSYLNDTGISEILNFKKYIDDLKVSDIRNLAVKYFNMKNYAKFTLIPEN